MFTVRSRGKIIVFSGRCSGIFTGFTRRSEMDWCLCADTSPLVAQRTEVLARLGVRPSPVNMAHHVDHEALDPFLTKESFSALASIGFGKKKSRLGAHRFHGVAARNRYFLTGKVTYRHIYGRNMSVC